MLNAARLFGKGVLATALTVIPVLIKQFAGPVWSIQLLFLFGLAIFFGSMKLLQPDTRFLTIREPTVRNLLKNALANAGPSIRANVYICRGFWRFRYLVPVISYNANPSQADYGKNWRIGTGLCWQVFETGKFGICRKGVHDPASFGMKPADVMNTDHVEAVLCMPLRKLGSRGDDGISSKVSAVLAYDAISAEGAEFLQREHDSLLSVENKKLLDLVESISLYF